MEDAGRLLGFFRFYMNCVCNMTKQYLLFNVFLKKLFIFVCVTCEFLINHVTLTIGFQVNVNHNCSHNPKP